MQLILDIDKLKIEQTLRLRVQDEIRKYSDWLYFDCQQQVDDVMFTSPTGFEHNLALGAWIPDTKGNVEFFVLHLSSPKIGKEMWRFGFDKENLLKLLQMIKDCSSLNDIEVQHLIKDLELIN